MNSTDEAVTDIHDSATMLMGGFGGTGHPTELLHALLDQCARINNNADNHEVGLAALSSRPGKSEK